MLVSWVQRLKRKLELKKYDDFSIGEYFRKQGAKIGENNRIMVRYLGESPGLVAIGNHCTISSEVAFLTHDGAGWIFTEELPDLQRFGKIQIMDNCFIGARSMLLPNICIGPNAVVGAGSIVTKDVPPATVVAGNPARVISTFDVLREKMICTWNEQKPMDYLSDLHAGTVYHPRKIQKAKKRDKSRMEEYLKDFFWENS